MKKANFRGTILWRRPCAAAWTHSFRPYTTKTGRTLYVYSPTNLNFCDIYGLCFENHPLRSLCYCALLYNSPPSIT